MKPAVLHLVPFVCDGCNEILGPRTWDDLMPVGEVNETCPRCGDNHIAVYFLQSSDGKVNEGITGDLYSDCPKCGSMNTTHIGTPIKAPYKCNDCEHEFLPALFQNQSGE